MRTARFLLPISIACLAAASGAASGEAPGGVAPPAPPVPIQAEKEDEGAAWLGVFVGDAIDGGVQLVAVVAGGPAEKAGLRAGDLMLRLDGQPVPDRDAIDVLTSRIHPGTRVGVEIVREGRRQTRWLETVPRTGPAWSQLVAGSAPEAFQDELSALLAATVVAIPEMLRVHYGAPTDRGALVTRLHPSGAAAAAGLRIGDVVLTVDGGPVRDPLAYRVDPGRTSHRVEVVRDGAPVVIAWSSASAPDRSDEVRALRAEIERLGARVKQLERELELAKRRRVQ